MAICPKYLIDSNTTGLAYAVEECPGQLPDSPIWRSVLPNSYNDMGGSITTAAREPITATRQNQKGTITGMTASTGFEADVVHDSDERLLAGFFYDYPYHFTHTNSDLYSNAAAVATITAGAITLTIPALVNNYKHPNVSSGMEWLVYLDGFTNSANNGIKHCTFAISGTTVTLTAITETDITADTVNGKEQAAIVGLQFPAGSLALNFDATGPTYTLTTTESVNLNNIFDLGNWIFIGGDDAATQFGVTGYARVNGFSTDDLSITLGEPSFTLTASDSGEGKTIQLYFGSYLKNGATKLTYQFERTLGEDAAGTQAQYVMNCVPNEWVVTANTAALMTQSYAYVATSTDERTGIQGLKSGSRIAAATTETYNTSSDVFRLRLSVDSLANSSPESLFAYVQEATVTTTNNASAQNALGVLGALDVTAGNFVVTGSVTAYFATVDALTAIRENADCGFNMIVAAKNKGFILDIPLLSVGGGIPGVTKDDPVTIPLDLTGAQNTFGYTMMRTQFYYLPDIAMPKV
jgi:hypothetical protein